MSAPNPANVRWGDVREKIVRERDDARDALVTAKLDDVPRLQGKVQAYDTLINWFERGAIAEKALSDIARSSTPHAQGY